MTWWDRLFFCGLFLMCAGWLLWANPQPPTRPIGERGRDWSYLLETFGRYNVQTRMLARTQDPLRREALSRSCRSLVQAYNDAAPYAPPRYFAGTSLPSTLDLENCK